MWVRTKDGLVNLGRHDGVYAQARGIFAYTLDVHIPLVKDCRAPSVCLEDMAAALKDGRKLMDLRIYESPVPKTKEPQNAD